jgi:hypothetical protein
MPDLIQVDLVKEHSNRAVAAIGVLTPMVDLTVGLILILIQVVSNLLHLIPMQVAVAGAINGPALAIGVAAAAKLLTLALMVMLGLTLVHIPGEDKCGGMRVAAVHTETRWIHRAVPRISACRTGAAMA